jgi:hypothetical protein
VEDGEEDFLDRGGGEDAWEAGGMEVYIWEHIRAALLLQQS